MAFTVWDTVQKSAGLTLSGGNLTATGNISLNGVRAADTQTSGKFYFEITTGATYGTSQNSIGICNGNVSSSNIANSMGSTLLNVAITAKGSGNIFVNNVNSGLTIGAIAINTVVCVAVDLSAKLIWFRKGAAGSWNATSGSTNDPATGVGGASIASIAPAYQNFYPAIGLASSGDTVTANFGATGFTGSVPSGYTSGWTTGVTALSDVIATQIGASAWVTNTHAPFNVTQIGASIWIANQVVAAYPLGVSGTGGAGTVTTQIIIPGLDVPITGVAGTGAAGSPTISISANPAITGVETDSAVGTPSISLGGSVAISGVESTGIAGSVIAEADISLIGVESVGQVGTPTISATANTALTGVPITTGIGGFTFQIDADQPITGVQSSGLAGSPVPSIAPMIDGVELTASVGDPTVEITFLNGVEIVCGIGPVTPSIDAVRLTGVQIAASIGHPLAQVVIPNRTLVQINTGVQATATIGHPIPRISIGIEGVESTAQVGQLTTLNYSGVMAITDLMVIQDQSIDEDTMLTLRWSDTEGQSWNMPVDRQMGKTGEYLTNIQWQRLGMSRRGRVFELSWSTPNPTCLIGASLKMTDAST